MKGKVKFQANNNKIEVKRFSDDYLLLTVKTPSSDTSIYFNEKQMEKIKSLLR